ncbi:MAG: hypothetical protein KJ887_04975 [Candidatus Omnitrophica bacterium]|nr:hypothetical protein [Candidatus Omnitrophota bacterium]MBU1047032.1 hypothetical protein [Candidatus Omnitrophota bacterium]MBU1767266.1 hypothetical protein [Candidatus Omnitrophota bacterium]MBU1889298.1 hypothetical protein [Candidatus Omnitrophota bacterium]
MKESNPLKANHMSPSEKGKSLSSLVNLFFGFLFIILGMLTILFKYPLLPKMPAEGSFLFFIANFLLITGLIAEILEKVILKSFSWWNLTKIITGIVLLEIWIYMFGIK